jgi:hypothetical protein
MLADGKAVGCIFFVPAALEGRPSVDVDARLRHHEDRTRTREAAMGGRRA